MLPGTAEVGSTANSYEILAKLATGGMAEIFLARGASGGGVERYVVLKRVLRNRASDEHFVRMFLDEARLAAQLQHPNIAQVYDLGKLGDSYFFTMEYVHGETVRALINRSTALRRQVPISAVLAIAAGAAAGLHHAHDRRDTSGRALDIVHRDVSPSNLMLSYEGAVKVVDFGVAKASHRSQETASGTVKGKIAYLSPEQCRASSGIDRRSDIFSLGIVMWELLTLERLYRRNSDFEQMIAIVQEPPRRPSQVRADVPPELDALVLRCLEKDPRDRFQTADEMHAAIEDVAVRIGTALSTASLGRFVRELFGQRPEPWVEMRAADQHVEGVTVTSEPIPANLHIPPADSVDLRLNAVVDLSDAPSDTSARKRVPSEMQPTAQLPVASPPTVQFAGAAPAMPIQHTPSGPVMMPMPMSGTGSVPSASGMGPYPVVPMTRASAPDLHRHQSRVRIAVITSVLVAGGLLAFLIASRSGGDTVVEAPAPPETATPPTDPPAATPGSDTAATAPAPTLPAPQPTPPTPQPQPTGSATPAPTPPTPQPSPEPRPRQPRPQPQPQPSPGDEIAKLFAADRFADTVAACSASSSAAAQYTTSCVIAACHVHDVAHAKKWLKAAGSKRAGLVAQCSALKTVLEEPKTNCEADPLSCQH